MGTVLSALPFINKIDDVDDELGFTEKEKFSVRQTWEIVKKDMKAISVDAFVRFFTVHPEYQELFRAFADVPLSELRQNKKFAAHATAVIYSLSSMVENLDDSENLKELAIKLTESHFPRGVSGQQFSELGKVIVDFLGERLGKSLTTPAKSGWEKLFSVIVSIAGDVAKQNSSQ